MKLLVVNYHYFREEIYPSGIYPINLKKLSAQVDLLGKNHTFVSQLDLIEFLEGKRPALDKKRCCMLTWDDGLREQMNSFDFLTSIGIPSTYFIPTMPIFESKILDVHKLHFIRSVIKDEEIEDFLNIQNDYKEAKFDYNLLNNQYRYDNIASQKIKYYFNFILNADRRELVLDEILSKLKSSKDKYISNLYMNKQDLLKLSKSNSLGSHGNCHIPLGITKSEEAISDVNKSVLLLEELTKQKVMSFSFPYGGAQAVGRNVEYLFKENSIKIAFTMQRGYNDFTYDANSYYIKRVDTNDVNQILNSIT